MNRRMVICAALIACCATVAAGATYEAPVEVGAGGAVTFVQKPEATAAGGAVRIAFEVSAAADVEVAVLDAKGTVVRHLAAGLLGKNAPEPFRKDSLKQEITWDGKDDLGAAAQGGPFKVRVLAGSRPKLDAVVGWDGNTLGSTAAGLAVSDKGEVYVLLADGHGRSAMRVFDKDGKYARTIMPYPANTPKERAAPVGQLEVGGERIPIVFNGHAGNLSPLTSGMKTQNMAWSPKGYVVAASAVGNWANHRPPRYLLAFHPEGGAPEGVGFVGPLIRGLADRGIGFLGGAGEGGVRWFDHLATSPDGEFIYLVQAGYSSAFKLSHCVHRVKWSDHKPGPPPRGKAYMDFGPDELGKPFFGETGKAGADDAHLNAPQGVATDKDGNVYVCDHGNGRVMVLSAEAKLLGKFAVPQPEQIAVHPRTGEVYVVSQAPPVRGQKPSPATLRKFSAWKAGEEPKELGKLEAALGVIALDPAATPPKLWAVVGGGLAPISDDGAKFAVGKAVDNVNGVKFPGFLAPDPARNRIIYREMLTGQNPIRVIDLATGARQGFLPGTDAVLDRQGNIYVMGRYGSNAMLRYDPSGKPLAFPGTGSNKLETGDWSSYGPDIGLRGHCVALNGDIYLIRSNKWTGGVVNRVDVFGPDGKPKKPNFIDGLQAGDCGIGVDAAGNVYIGINAKPKDHPVSKPFEGKVPTQAWDYWRFDRQGPRDVPWCYPYQNPYIYHFGSVFKFGPQGGAIYGFSSKPKDGPVPTLAEVKNAPEGSATYWSGYLKSEGRITGALWRYAGIGPVPASDFGWGDPACICWNSRLGVDLYGRVFAPDVFRFCVDVLDTNGNEILRIGRYGNSDSAGPKSAVPEPEIAFAWPATVAVAEGKVYVSDSANRRIVVVAFDHAATAECAVP